MSPQAKITVAKEWKENWVVEELLEEEKGKIDGNIPKGCGGKQKLEILVSFSLSLGKVSIKKTLKVMEFFIRVYLICITFLEKNILFLQENCKDDYNGINHPEN